MSVAFGWFLVVSFGVDGARELVATIPNEGFTEKVGDRWVDLYVKDGAVREDAADVAPVLDELERRLKDNGSISTTLAARLELVRTICMELPKSSHKEALRFRDHKVRDLDDTLLAVEEAIDELGARRDPALDALHKCLHRAQALHVAVVFGM